ncbi:unnamed protein product [Rhizophagus irregularis]|nr:unnamed protein product [Rhizophagus irregularis]
MNYNTISFIVSEPQFGKSPINFTQRVSCKKGPMESHMGTMMASGISLRLMLIGRISKPLLASASAISLYRSPE